MKNTTILNLVGLLVWMPIAQADLLSLEYQAKIESISYFGKFPGRPFSIGDIVFGKITYDLDTVDTYVELDSKDSFPNTGLYTFDPRDADYFGITATVNNHTFKLGPDRVVVFNDEFLNLGGADKVIFRAVGVDIGPEPIYPLGLTHGTIRWQLTDASMGALNSHELPTDVNVESWPENEFQMAGDFIDHSATSPEDNRGYGFSINGTVIDVNPVPIPTSILLFCSGILAFIGVRRKQNL